MLIFLYLRYPSFTSIRNVYNDYKSGLVIAESNHCKNNQYIEVGKGKWVLDEVQTTIDAIKYVDQVNKKNSFAIAILMPGDLMFITPSDIHCVITCHEQGVNEFGSIAAGTIIYTDVEEHNHRCIQ